MKRKVYIEHRDCNYLVVYLERKKGGRYLASQFNDVDNDLDYVIKWVESQKGLELVNNPNE